MLRWVAAFLVLFFASPAAASFNCASYESIRQQLAEKWHEQPVAFALTSRGSVVVVVFAAQDGKTWTLVYASPVKKMACVDDEDGTGTNWRSVPWPALTPGGAM